MKKSTMVVTIVLLVVIVGLVGVYAFLTGRAKTDAESAVMTQVQKTLMRDLTNDYPATVKEVVKYYTEIERCMYNEQCTDEEIDALGMQARTLFDADLQAINEVGTYLSKTKEDIQIFKNAKRRISSISVAASTNVDFFEDDGFEFARIYCGYSVSESGKNSVLEGRVYLLRRDDQRHWKIYGWARADAVNPQ